MPIEALWSIQFISDLGSSGGGVVIFRGGHVLGGDAQYTFSGTYDLKGDLLTVKARASLYAGEPNSIFGSLVSFNVAVAGKYNEREMVLDGRLRGGADNAMQIICTRRLELP